MSEVTLTDCIDDLKARRADIDAAKARAGLAVLERLLPKKPLAPAASRKDAKPQAKAKPEPAPKAGKRPKAPKAGAGPAIWERCRDALRKMPKGHQVSVAELMKATEKTGAAASYAAVTAAIKDHPEVFRKAGRGRWQLVDGPNGKKAKAEPEDDGDDTPPLPGKAPVDLGFLGKREK